MLVIFRLVCSLVLVLLAAAAQAQNKVPGERPLEALVKSSLLTFNDANVTNNYTVLHAKLSQPFRVKYPPEKLAETFKVFRDKRIDFDIIAALKPVYDPAPKVDDDGKLLVEGHFDPGPARVAFELDFIPSDGEWKLIRLNVKVNPK
ncbi:MAG: hypothetical protein AB7F22_14220 [Reyranella sp.]|uniref:hypothetical protein n=1 Tax=Reyranella sp. TaxID=1929291 RepID=UPI003D0B6DFA